MTECDSESSVPDWLIEHPETLSVFNKLELDCSCGGRSLRFLCEQNDMDIDIVVASLLRAVSEHDEAKLLKLRCSGLGEINSAKTQEIIPTHCVSFEVARLCTSQPAASARDCASAFSAGLP